MDEDATGVSLGVRASFDRPRVVTPGDCTIGRAVVADFGITGDIGVVTGMSTAASSGAALRARIVTGAKVCAGIEIAQDRVS